MSGSLIIVLIIVVWLFVLAPLLLRGQKPIRKAGEAFDDTRVIHEGGSADIPVRRRPRLAPTGVRRTEVVEELDDIEVDDVLLDAPVDPDRADVADADEADVENQTAETPRTFSGLFTRRVEDAEVTEVDEADIVDGAVVHELEPAVAAEEDSDLVTAEAEWDDWDDWDEETTYAYDDSFTSPADLMYPDSVDSVVEIVDEDADEDSQDLAESAELTDADLEDADVDAATAEDSDMDLDADDELSEEEIEFAEHRAARGGWDPVADAANSLTRYQRRQRTLIGLTAAVVLTTVLAFIVGGWTWFLAGAAVVATVVYLVALRNQVLAEQALRARRVRQLRRARLGVLNSADEELAIPRNLRHPGAVILERDDESPDFAHLPVIETHVEQEPAPSPARAFRRPERFSDDRRAG